MFTYALLEGVNEGYLDNCYLIYAQKAYNGIIEHLIEVDQNGEVHLTQCNAGAGLSDDRPGTYEYYISEEFRPDNPKGVGPFILASLEIEKLRARFDN